MMIDTTYSIAGIAFAILGILGLSSKLVYEDFKGLVWMIVFYAFLIGILGLMFRTT